MRGLDSWGPRQTIIKHINFQQQHIWKTLYFGVVFARLYVQNLRRFESIIWEFWHNLAKFWALLYATFRSTIRQSLPPPPPPFQNPESAPAYKELQIFFVTGFRQWCCASHCSPFKRFWTIARIFAWSLAFYKNLPYYSIIIHNIGDMMRGDVNTLTVDAIKVLTPQKSPAFWTLRVGISGVHVHIQCTLQVWYTKKIVNLLDKKRSIFIKNGKTVRFY